MKTSRFLVLCSLLSALSLTSCGGSSRTDQSVDLEAARAWLEERSGSSSTLLGAASCNLTVTPAPFDEPINMPVFQGNQNWMEQMSSTIGDRQLRNVALPGSHDSGTYMIDGHSALTAELAAGKDADAKYLMKWWDDLTPAYKVLPVTSALASWARAQRHITIAQLMSGVRYLDLRVIPNADGSKFHITHSLQSEDFDHVIADVSYFISTHPKEIIILNFQHLFSRSGEDGGMSAEDAEALLYKITYWMGYKMLDRGVTSSPSTPTISELWSLDRQVVVLFDSNVFNRLSDDSKRVVWDKTDLTQYWGQTTTWWGDTGTYNYLNSVIANANSQKSISVLQAQMTPTPALIAERATMELLIGAYGSFYTCMKAHGTPKDVADIKDVLDKLTASAEKHTRSLKAEAQDSNPQLQTWVLANKPRHIVLADFVGDYPDLIQAIIDSNK